MTKYEKDIIEEIENYRECFIGTYEVQGTKVFKRFNKIRKEWEKHHNSTLAYDSDNGICWEV